ncbi:MAG: GAP family protein [Solirubrobacteraceae bacterium]
MGQTLLLSLTASLNPTLLAATTVMLLLPNPATLMGGYLLGALMMSITLGLVIVFALPHSSTTTTTQHTLSPAVDIGLGALALIAALVLASQRQQQFAQRRKTRKEARKQNKGPSRWERELSKGSPRITFLIGAALSLPGASYLAGLAEIHNHNSSTTATVALVIGFNLIMLWLLEVPLIGFLLAPEGTRQTIHGARARLSERGRLYLVRGLSVIGTLLIIKGIIGLIAG